MSNHNSTTAILNPDRSIDKVAKRWGGDPRSRRLQIVCGPCNHHWMSDLQSAAKPIIIPLIAGKSINLTLENQKILAAWAAMSVICAEYFYPKSAAVSVTARRWLYQTHTAPNDFRIWIGDFDRKEWVPHWGHSSVRISLSEYERPQGWTVHPDGTPRVNTQTTVFVVERLFILAYSCPFPEILHNEKIVEAVDSRLSQIWPPRHSFLLWPPADTLSDRSADNLAGSIFSRLDEAGTAFGV
ncbi:MAG: hypothetical protein E8A46_10360 [Bradyrhizobium sp.]|jgi:hypothetical protein|uniref:hypothetical protein n=1 Tax=Bradyrhizobium sp. TaxID=376 RepID=UPI00120974C9|nr:hypothetical protein [Bradyrhizobium sp.]THD53624.1 MAG: hypothetical protein E8A46_10360 [Bradyrhizobium sp.]